MIILTEQQANELKGDYGKFSRLEPVKIPFSELYCISEGVLKDIEFESIWSELKELPTAPVYFDWHEAKPIRVVISNETINDWILKANKDKLMERVTATTMLLGYFEANKLSVIEENGNNYLYLNTIFPEHEAALIYGGASVEYQP